MIENDVLFFTTGTWRKYDLRIDACQGHSKVLYGLAQLDILRTPCIPIYSTTKKDEDPSSATIRMDYAYYGTTQEAWEAIQTTGYLHPGTRKHVCVNPSKAAKITQVRSTVVRHQSQDTKMGVVLTIRLHNNTNKNQKIKFYLSKNNVVLSEQPIPIAAYSIQAELIMIDCNVTAATTSKDAAVNTKALAETALALAETALAAITTAVSVGNNKRKCSSKCKSSSRIGITCSRNSIRSIIHVFRLVTT